MLNMRKCRGPCQHLWKRSRAIKKSVHQAEDSRRTLTIKTLTIHRTLREGHVFNQRINPAVQGGSGLCGSLSGIVCSSINRILKLALHPPDLVCAFEMPVG